MEEITTKPNIIPLKMSLMSGMPRLISLPSSDVIIVRTSRSTSVVSNIGLWLAAPEEPPKEEEATPVAFSGGEASTPLRAWDSSSRGTRFIVWCKLVVLESSRVVQCSVGCCRCGMRWDVGALMRSSPSDKVIVDSFRGGMRVDMLRTALLWYLVQLNRKLGNITLISEIQSFLPLLGLEQTQSVYSNPNGN